MSASRGTQTRARRTAAVAAFLIAAVPGRALACVGDCDFDYAVTVNELVTCVNIALGSDVLATCPQCSRDGEPVGISELISAVDNALSGCPPPFVDNGDGTVSDTQRGLIWEKKDQDGGLHDENAEFSWAGDCPGDEGFCQPDAAAASACATVTGGAPGCALCTLPQTCDTYGTTTIWQWLTQLNTANFAGHSDWRIPTVDKNAGKAELETILDLYVLPIPGCNAPPYPPCTVPAFNTACTVGCSVNECSCTEPYDYWSATIAPVRPDGAWYVNFIDRDIEYADSLKENGFVRAVRGGPPNLTPAPTATFLPTATPTPAIPRFVDNGDGTISDGQTGLIWEKKDQGGGLHDAKTYYTWSGYCSDNSGFCQPEAAAATTCAVATKDVGCAQCTGSATCNTSGYSTIWQWLNRLNASNFAGHSDWRIPTVLQGGRAELETLIDGSAPGCREFTGPCVPSAFDTACTAECTVIGCSCTRAYYYWSASTYSVSPGTAWYVSFGGGSSNTTFETENAYVRAVRRGS